MWVLYLPSPIDAGGPPGSNTLPPGKELGMRAVVPRLAVLPVESNWNS
jgi:hypothetical protein